MGRIINIDTNNLSRLQQTLACLLVAKSGALMVLET